MTEDRPTPAGLHLRPYRPGDVKSLVALIRASVLELGPAAYSAREVAAWVRSLQAADAMRSQLAHGCTIVAELAREPVGCAQLHPADRVALLYVAPAHARRGIGSALCAAVEAAARAAGTALLRTEASRVARPLFAARGYLLAKTETVVRAGVPLERFAMVKRLGSGAGGHGA